MVDAGEDIPDEDGYINWDGNIGQMRKIVSIR